jgi:glycosyltransferase involved in cell wall biosynthesis
VLQKNGLEENGFLLYPANFWPHKNHSMLLTAFGMFRHRHPESRLQLVCTGFPDERMDALREAVQRMGLRSLVILPGYLSEEELAALLASCKALIFPSLYEGFGMPVLEAMAFSKPILCSNVTSLPEVAGDCALLFDPKKPQEILGAIEQIMTDSKLASSLVERGKVRIARWGGPEQMARQYLAVFHALAVKNGTAKTLRSQRIPI